MVKVVAERLRPTKGFAHLFHLSLVAIMPIVAFVFVRLEFYGVALAVVLLSKWRMFAVHPRYWIAHIRTNAVDIIVSLSLLAFMIAADSMSVQLLWVVIFEAWVLYLKPGSNALLVSFQALAAQLVGAVAIFLAFPRAPLSVSIILISAISYFVARHFFASFEEKNVHVYSWVWTFFSACLMWVLGHWLLFYGPIAQLAVLLTVIGYGLAVLYYLHETDRLSVSLQRQVLFVVFAITFVLLALSDWGDKTL
jgi:hypothetical protein